MSGRQTAGVLPAAGRPAAGRPAAGRAGSHSFAPALTARVGRRWRAGTAGRRPTRTAWAGWRRWPWPSTTSACR